MVSWSDGVEYAPTERPDGFAMPRTSPLELPAKALSPAGGHPDAAPSTYHDAPGRRPLETLVPSSGPRRDPHAAFSAGPPDGFASSSFDPRAPMATTAVLDAPVFEPEPLQWEPEPAPVEPRLGVPAAEIANVVGVPLLVCLVVGTALWMLAFPLLVLGLVLVISQPERPLSPRLRAALAVASASALVLGFLVNVMDDSLYSMGRYSQLGCLVCLGLGLWWGWRQLVPQR